MQERMQKTSPQGNDCPQRDRTESERYEGVQTYIWMTEDNVVEVPFDKEHLLEVILSPKNLNDAYKCVVRNKGCGGVDKMSCEQLLLWLSANKEKTVVCYVRGVKYLGYSFYINKGKCLLTVHPKTKAKMRCRLKELTCRSNGMGYAKRKKTPPLHKGLGELLSPCHYEETDRENRRVVTATLAYVYMEVMEASQDPNQEPR